MSTNSGELSIPDVPDHTYRITRGSPPGESGYPSNWHTLTVTRPGVPTDDDPEPGEIVVATIGFAGP